MILRAKSQTKVYATHPDKPKVCRTVTLKKDLCELRILSPTGNDSERHQSYDRREALEVIGRSLRDYRSMFGDPEARIPKLRELVSSD